jgi:hypothetical protein
MEAAGIALRRAGSIEISVLEHRYLRDVIGAIAASLRQKCLL